MNQFLFPRSLALLTLMLATMTLAACLPPPHEDMPTDDNTITQQVKQAFATESRLDLAEMSVITTNGVVKLDGFVYNAKAEDKAVQLAKAVDGVKAVQDKLIVKTVKLPDPNYQ